MVRHVTALVWILLAFYAECTFSAGNVNSCDGRCAPGHDHAYPCQCNEFCQDYGDCCHDYEEHCVPAGGGGNCDAFFDVTEYFWTHDVNCLLPSQYSVNWQASVSSGNTVDHAPNKFFSHVDETVFTARPTFVAFVSLLNNYYSHIGTREHISAQERAEMDHFYRLIKDTAIFVKLYRYLICKGIVSSASDFQSKFYGLWFDLYPRSSSSQNILDSSGFEHVMVGEIEGVQRVSGFHSWIQFYEEERLGRLNYYGYVRRQQPVLAGMNFAWRPSQTSVYARKGLGSFFMATSPEFDLALYTLCALQYTNSMCTVRLGGSSYRIQTWDISHKSGLQIGSAYLSL